jgi:signal transduction histidine kinase
MSLPDALRHFRPNGIGAQLALLVAGSIGLAHAVITLLLFLSSSVAPTPTPGGWMNGAASIARMLHAGGPGAFDSTLAAARRAFPDLTMQIEDSPPPASGRPLRGPITRRLAEETAGLLLRAEESAAGDRLAFRLADDRYLVISGAMQRPPPLLGGPVLLTISFFSVALMLLGVWAARMLVQPLGRLASAAQRFDPALDQPPLPETGPAELRTLAAALNAMSVRVRRLVEQRTQMLAAIGHDLRTPITRMRLRVEEAQNESLRDGLVRDLSHMANMVDSALAFLRDGDSGEQATALDLASLLKSICDDWSDLGETVTFEGPDHLVVSARPDSLRRALSNVIENAVKFAGAAKATLSSRNGMALIDVLDGGPGVPVGTQDDLLKPFVRGDAARTADGRSGFGLGLSIANGVVADHGGSLRLENRAGGGLAVQIGLPLLRPAA